MNKGTCSPAWEWRAAGWACRHPLMTAAPAALGAGVVELGAPTMGGIVGGAALGLTGWYRGHPATFEPIIGMRLRSLRRRWLTYVGRRWADVMHDCELATANRRTGQVRVPRIIRVRSATPTLDTIYVRMLRGQHAGTYTDRAEALADALLAERVAVTRLKPGVVALTVERGNPFTAVTPAADIPETAADVDLTALEFGEDEYGGVWTENLTGGRHFLGVGATGSGKSGLLWQPLRAAGPAIRAGIVRVRMIDLKGGIETQAAEKLFYRHATDVKSALDVLEEHRDDMKAAQARLRKAGLRKSAPSVETPLDWLMVDEFAMLSSLAEGKDVRRATQLLAEILTQGRATGETVCAYLQEPDKNTNPLRELFPVRVCLRVTDDKHVNMALGDRMRERGALADQIPMDDEHTAIGFKAHRKSRTPVRVRVGLVEDKDVTELASTCAPQPLAEVTQLPTAREGVSA